MQKWKGKRALIIEIIAIILFVIGFAIRMIARHPEYVDKGVSMTEVITYQDVEYEISKIETSSVYNDESAPEGVEFLMITLNITNHSDKRFDSNNDSWELKCSSGIFTRSYSNYLDFTAHLYDVIYPQESKEIQLVFKKKIKDTPGYLVYYKGMMTSKATFTFKLE